MTVNNIIAWLHSQENKPHDVSPYLMIRPRSYRQVLQDIVRKRILERGKKHISGWEQPERSYAQAYKDIQAAKRR